MKKELILSILFFFIFGCSSRFNTYEDMKNSFLQEEEKSPETISTKDNFSLNDAIFYAIDQNLQLQAILQQKNIAKGQFIEALSFSLPHFSAKGAYTQLDKTPAIGEGEQKTIVGDKNNYSLNLQARQALFTGGKILSGIRSSQLFEWFSDEQISFQLQKTIFEVTKAYYDVLLAKHLHYVNEIAVESAKKHLIIVRQKKSEGLASHFDELRAEVDVSNFQAERLKQKNAFQVFNTRLFKIMGFSQKNIVNLSDDLFFYPIKISFEKALETAFSYRPDLFIKELEKRMQKESVKQVYGEYFPHLHALFQQEWGKPDPHKTTLDRWGKQWSAILSLEWPLFEGARKIGKLKKEKSLLKQKNILLSDLKESIRLEIQEALLHLQTAEEFVLTQKLDLKRAKEGLKIIAKGYQEGINTEVEVVDARSSMTRAKSLHYQAIYQHCLARLQLEFALGILGKNYETYMEK